MRACVTAGRSGRWFVRRGWAGGMSMAIRGVPPGEEGKRVVTCRVIVPRCIACSCSRMGERRCDLALVRIM